MRIIKAKEIRKAQAAIEYLLLLGVLTVVALIGFKTLIPNTRESTEVFFNATVNGVMGPVPSDARLRRDSVYP